MEMPQEAGANPFADPNTMAVYEQMRQTVSPKEFGDEMLAGAEQAAPEEVAAFRSALEQIEMPPEALELLNNMVDEILANPEQYDQIRAKYKEMGAPDEILPEQFDPQFFAALNMAVDQMIGEPAGVQAFAKGGIAELTPVSKAIADYGRNGDTMLAHITPAEARMLRRKGGSGTINPDTGLPEFFSLFKAIGKAFKAVGKAVKSFASSTVGRIVTTVALGFFLGPAAATFMGATSTAAVAAVSGFVGSAGSTLLAGGNLKDALKAGAVGGLTAGATAGVTGAFSGTDAFAAGSYTGPTTIGGQIDKFTGAVTPPPFPEYTAQGALTDNATSNAAREAYAGELYKTNPEAFYNPNTAVGDATAGAGDSAFAAKKLSVGNVGEQVTMPNGAVVTQNAATPFAPTATNYGAFGEAPLSNTAMGSVAPPVDASAATATSGNAVAPPINTQPPAMTSASTGNAIAPAIDPYDPSTATRAADYGFKANPSSGSSLFDQTKDFYNKNISPSGIQQGAAGDAISTVQRTFPTATAEQIMNAPAGSPLAKAYSAAMPGIFSTYGPMTALGIGTIGAFGGFSPRPIQESDTSKMLKGGPGSAESLMRDNPYRFYVQNMPGVQYYDGSLRKPPGMATGGIVDAMPEHFAIGGGVDKQLYDAYVKGDYAAANKIISDNKVTAAEIQTRFNLSPADMAYIDTRPTGASGDINYYTPTKAETDAANVGIATLNPQGEAYSAADTAMYNAFRAGDYNLLNGLMATYSVTPAYIKTKFGLSDADIGYITGQGGKFAATGPAAIKDTSTGTSSVFSTTPGFSLTPGGLKTIPKTTVGGTQMPTGGTGSYPAIDDLQIAAGMDVSGITPQKYAVASGLGLPEVTTRYYNAKNEAILGNYSVDPATGKRTPIAARAPVAQTYNNANALSAYLSPTGPLGELSTRKGTPVVPDAPVTATGTLPNVSFNRTDIQQRMPMIPADYPPTGTAPAKLMNMGGIAGLAQGGYPRRNGQINGPGTATSDSIPAMLSDGEFVMTAKAVRGAGKGDRRAGAKRMYALMHQLEKNAARG
jgi:hypothetical protein